MGHFWVKNYFGLFLLTYLSWDPTVKMNESNKLFLTILSVPPLNDVYNVCNQIKLAFNAKIASISIDNAASKVAGHVAKKLNTDGDPTHPLRNPAHCIDLLSKDQAMSLYTQFWQKQKRCLICASPIKLIISARRQFILVISL
jgi:hypothetical protein